MTCLIFLRIRHGLGESVSRQLIRGAMVYEHNSFACLSSQPEQFLSLPCSFVRVQHLVHSGMRD